MVSSDIFCPIFIPIPSSNAFNKILLCRGFFGLWEEEWCLMALRAYLGDSAGEVASFRKKEEGRVLGIIKVVRLKLFVELTASIFGGFKGVLFVSKFKSVCDFKYFNLWLPLLL